MLSNYVGSSENNVLQFARNKMAIGMVHGWKLQPGEGPFAQEGSTRSKMNSFLQKAGIGDGDILIISDVDEIPRAEVVDLYRKCEGMPDILHLDMPVYIYSYGFRMLGTTWKAAIHKFKHGRTFYSHGQVSDVRLSDSGWHCSFCFGTLSAFQFKMQAYSHAERASWHPVLATPEHIQAQICAGQDLFNMWPEAFTFGDLLTMAKGYTRVLSGHDLPKWVVENRRMSWLRPGGDCRRPLE